ncbi:MAG: hypothetical protein ACT4PE_06780 [Candidatus Eiseniibacteriota bacterium]
MTSTATGRKQQRTLGTCCTAPGQRQAKLAAASTAALLVLAQWPAAATPSSTLWTNCTIDIQPYRVLHLTYDNYTTIGEDGPAAGGQQFANDLGLTVGVLPFHKLQMEIALDWLEPSDHPAFLAAKAGAPEGALFEGAPALQLGIFNVGTEKGVTDQNVVHLIVGRSLPSGLGRLHASAYAGSSDLLRSSTGEEENTGLMLAYDRGLWPVEESAGGYKRVVLAADWCSGDNALGGGGVGVYYYFAGNVSILSGPLWFNDDGLNGDWKWTTQLDANVEF